MSENTTDNTGAVALKKWFDMMPDPMQAVVQVFNGPEHSGFIIKWAKKGIGFGEFTIGVNNETLEVFADDECMGGEFITEVFKTLCDGKQSRYLTGKQADNGDEQG